MRPVVFLIFMGAPLNAWGGIVDPECYPLATAIEALIHDGTLDEPVFIEEWSTCVGDGVGGPSAVALPEGEHGDTRGILDALVGVHNGSGGLNYDVRRVGPGWSVAPDDRPRCAETPVDPIESGQHLLEVERMVMKQFEDHCGLRTAGRAIGPELLTMVEAPTTSETLPAATVLSTTLAVMFESGDPVGWSQRILTVEGKGASLELWTVLPVQEPPNPNPWADRPHLPPGVRGILGSPDGSLRHILDDGTIVEVKGPDEDADRSDEEAQD